MRLYKAVCVEGANAGGSGQRQPLEVERDFNGDEQGPDALESIFGSAERQDSHRLHKVPRELACKACLSDPGQSARHYSRVMQE